MSQPRHTCKIVTSTDGNVFKLIIIEIDLALTLAATALDADYKGKRDRNIEKAFAGYRTVLRIIDKHQLTPDENSVLQIRLRPLRAALRDLGRIAA